VESWLPMDFVERLATELHAIGYLTGPQVCEAYRRWREAGGCITQKSLFA
jgi:hypothetical protein